MVTSARPTLFVIDDDASVQRALARLLNSADYNVITFSSVDTFLELKEWPSLGCVIADIRMPGIESLSLPKLLADKDLRYPVIYLTAQDTEENRDSASHAGAEAFFRKPVDDQALIDAINWAMCESGNELSNNQVQNQGEKT